MRLPSRCCGRKFQAAIDVLRSDVSQDVRALPPAHGYLVALAQQGLGKHQEALATLDSLSVEPGTDLARDVPLAKAASLVALDRHADAIAPLNEYLAATLDEDLARKCGALAQLALAYAQEKAFSEADSTLKRLIAAAPHSDLLGPTTLQLSQIARATKENSLAATWLESLDSTKLPLQSRRRRWSVWGKYPPRTAIWKSRPAATSDCSIGIRTNRRQLLRPWPALACVSGWDKMTRRWRCTT